MTTVRKHPSRRISAPRQARAFPNPRRGNNSKRIKKGQRPLHCHVKVRLVDLNKAVKGNPSRAIYGWLSARISKLTSEVERRRSMGISNDKDHTKDLATLANLQRAKHKLGYIIVGKDDKGDIQECLYRLQKSTFPTMLNSYDKEGRDGTEYIVETLSALVSEDPEYGHVLRWTSAALNV